jgi:hypothetical protein
MKARGRSARKLLESTDLPARSLNAHGREYVLVRKSYRPYGTSRLLTQIQALRTWLLSFCPYGTGYYRSVPAGQIQPTRRDKIRLDICLQNRLHRSRIYIRELRFPRETKLGDTIGLVRANPWLADNPLSVKFFPEVVP